MLSTGTASSGAKTRPVETPNQYQIIQIWPDHYKRWTRSYSLQMHRWIGDCSVSRFGNDWRAEIAHDSRAIFGTPWLVSASASAAIDFIDAGDPVTAQAILSYADSSLDIKHYLPIIQLKQKFGIHAQADVAELNEKILLSEENWDNDAYRELRITKVKLLSQDGLWDEVDGERVTCENLQSKTPTKARGVMHRLAFAEAIQRGFSGTVEGYFKESIAISRAATDGREVNQHSVITSEVLLEISRYFCSKSDGPLGVSDVVAKLAEAQQTYLRAHYDFSVGQAFPVKSAIQVLFAEAAFLLYENNESPSGWNRLLAANLLVSRYFFSPLSEGYAELLHAVYGEKHWCNNIKKSEAVVRKRKKLRELLESAMQTNRSQRLKFLKEVVEGIRRTQLLEMIEIFRLVPAHSPNPSDWKRLREFFDRCDNKFFFNDSIRHA